MRYAFIRAHENEFGVLNLCRMMQVQRSGYYAWRKQPKSPRQREDERVRGLIKQAWLESGCVYGYRKIHDELRSWGESSGRNRIARLMKQEGLKAQVGYKRPGYRGGSVSVLSPNLLEQNFQADSPNQVWVTDITYIRTYEGVAVSGGGHRPILTADRRVVDAAQDAHGPGSESTTYGGLATKAETEGNRAF